MRYKEFSNNLVEDDSKPLDNKAVVKYSKKDIIDILQKAGFEVEVSGNKITILTEIPDEHKKAKGKYRMMVMTSAINILKKELPDIEPHHSMERKFGSMGGIMFGKENEYPFYVLVKDKSTKGGGSSGKLNEENLVQLLNLFIYEYGTINVTFVDKHNKMLRIKDCDSVTDASFNVKGRRKADVELTNSRGESLPISLKQLDADRWESADSLFGNRAKAILEKLQKEGSINMQKLKDLSGEYYRLEKEIVIEPTPEEAMNAIFGTDLMPRGGVVIQTFKEEHFKQEENNITIQCEYIITDPSEIPESHLMVWVIINNKQRNNPLPGLRTLGVTLARGIGTRGTKDVVLVDQHGNVVKNPNINR